MKYQYTFSKPPYIIWDYPTNAELIAQWLDYSWKGEISKENPSLDSIVVWTPTPTKKCTILTLEHSGFKGFKNYIPYMIMNKGSVTNGKRLFKLLDELKLV